MKKFFYVFLVFELVSCKARNNRSELRDIQPESKEQSIYDRYPDVPKDIEQLTISESYMVFTRIVKNDFGSLAETNPALSLQHEILRVDKDKKVFFGVAKTDLIAILDQSDESTRAKLVSLFSFPGNETPTYKQILSYLDSIYEPNLLRVYVRETFGKNTFSGQSGSVYKEKHELITTNYEQLISNFKSDKLDEMKSLAQTLTRRLKNNPALQISAVPHLTYVSSASQIWEKIMEIEPIIKDLEKFDLKIKKFDLEIYHPNNEMFEDGSSQLWKIFPKSVKYSL